MLGKASLSHQQALKCSSFFKPCSCSAWHTLLMAVQRADFASWATAGGQLKPFPASTTMTMTTSGMGATKAHPKKYISCEVC